MYFKICTNLFTLLSCPEDYRKINDPRYEKQQLGAIIASCLRTKFAQFSGGVRLTAQCKDEVVCCVVTVVIYDIFHTSLSFLLIFLNKRRKWLIFGVCRFGEDVRYF